MLTDRYGLEAVHVLRRRTRTPSSMAATRHSRFTLARSRRSIAPSPPIPDSPLAHAAKAQALMREGNVAAARAGLVAAKDAAAPA